MNAIYKSPSVLLLLAFMATSLWAHTDEKLQTQGIHEYNQQNYEEAIEILNRARRQDPNSTLSAFFLGMAYKQTIDYANALPHLRDAVNLSPRIREALVELVDVLVLLGRAEHLDEALIWIDVAEQEKMFPARIAFLKGQVLRQDGQPEKAVQAFETAASLDDGLIQACYFQIGLGHLQQRNLVKAQEMFERAVLNDPESDLALFARKYRDMIEKRLFLERPLRLTVTVLGQYDTNMILKPTETSAAAGVTGEKGFTTTDSFQVEYIPRFGNPLNLYARYAALANLHEFNDNTHDIIGNSITIQPGITLGRVGLNLTAQFNHYLKREPDYNAYLGQTTVGPLVKIVVGERNFLEWFGGYMGRNYADDPSDPAEDRSSGGFNSYIGWFWIYSNRIFANLKYEYSLEDTDGANWQNTGHRAIAGVLVSLTDKLQLQLRRDQFNQNYENTHTLFNVKRRDRANASSIGLAWEWNPRLVLLTRFERTRCNSNIGLYDYTRNVTTLGAELRF